jgi:hypothetical protein
MNLGDKNSSQKNVEIHYVSKCMFKLMKKYIWFPKEIKFQYSFFASGMLMYMMLYYVVIKLGIR